MKKAFNFKTILRIFGYIVLAAVILFGAAVCWDGGVKPSVSGKTSTGTDLIVMDADMVASKLMSKGVDGTLVFTIWKQNTRL